MAELSPIDAAFRARQYAELNAGRNQRLAEQQRRDSEQRHARVVADERRGEAERRITNDIHDDREDVRALQRRAQRFDAAAEARLDELALRRDRRDEADFETLRAEAQDQDARLRDLSLERRLERDAALAAPSLAPAVGQTDDTAPQRPDERYATELRARNARLRERADAERLFERQQDVALRQADAAIRSTASPDPGLGRGALVDVSG